MAIAQAPALALALTIAQAPALTLALTIAQAPALTLALTIAQAPALTPALTIAQAPALTLALAIAQAPALAPAIAQAPALAPALAIAQAPALTLALTIAQAPALAPALAIAQAAPTIGTRQPAFFTVLVVGPGDRPFARVVFALTASTETGPLAHATSVAQATPTVLPDRFRRDVGLGGGRAVRGRARVLQERVGVLRCAVALCIDRQYGQCK
ncbi:MAG: hypothetical protein ACOX5J_17350 [Candidatus Hydrogenedentales bacterium]